MQSKATSVSEYIASLPPDRQAAIQAVRQVILENLDSDNIEEIMQYGMIGYAVPHRVYPAGYHCDPKQPLPYVHLASQKNYMSLYLTCAYVDPRVKQWFLDAWASTGKKLDMGGGCLRFKKVDDVALDVIGDLIRRTPARAVIERYEETLRAGRARKAGAGEKAEAGRGRASKKGQAVAAG